MRGCFSMRWALCVVVLLCCNAVPSEAGGGAKLWELGYEVEANPLTVFVMFGFTVFLTIMVEMIKHHVEHKTSDEYRLQSLQVIYSELMMIGVISFMLILGAELGLTDIRITIFCDDPVVTNDTAAAVASGSGSAAAVVASASGSGSECGIGFDLLLFEYAHLVLFGMGLSYCVFIQVSFRVRNQQIKDIEEIQTKTIMSFYEKDKTPAPTTSIMGWTCFNEGWARTILTLRSAIIINNEERIRNCCQPEETCHEQWLAAWRGEPIPKGTPAPEEALVHFDMARYSMVAVSEALIDLLHVPAIVWGGIIVMAAANLIHKAGLPLSDAVLIISGFGPGLSMLLLWRMSVQLSQVVTRAAGHPRIAEFDLFTAKGPRPEPGDTNPLGLSDKVAQPGRDWDVARRTFTANPTKEGKDTLNDEATPWAVLTGCCDDDAPWGFLDPLDPGALELQIQLVVFCTCFYFGQVIMLTTLIAEQHNIVWVIICWLVPLPPIIVWMPRCIMIFALTHKTRETPRFWLRKALQKGESVSHGHGHGGGGCCGFGGGKKGDDDHEEDEHQKLVSAHGPSRPGEHGYADNVSRAHDFGYAYGVPGASCMPNNNAHVSRESTAEMFDTSTSNDQYAEHAAAIAAKHRQKGLSSVGSNASNVSRAGRGRGLNSNIHSGPSSPSRFGLPQALNMYADEPLSSPRSGAEYGSMRLLSTRAASERIRVRDNYKPVRLGDGFDDS
eukprot:Hpha_TRINITY_DN15835_c0_g3::TRINITY_DN15835_c0_g3_i1::g.188768::m.188768